MLGKCLAAILRARRSRRQVARRGRNASFAANTLEVSKRVFRARERRHAPHPRFQARKGAKAVAYKIDKIEGIGPANAAKLMTAGIKTTGSLLTRCASPKGRKETASATGFSEAQLLKWANMADLMRVKGVGEEYSELLEAAGVDTVKELRTRRADNLTKKMAEVNETKKLVRRLPTESEVSRWVEHAKTLDPMMTY